jgi:pseudaminic acid synthase
MTSPTIEVNGRSVGSGRPVSIVAEMSGNHAGDFERAVRIIRAAREVGADAIKLQTYTADTITIDCASELFTVKGTLWNDRKLHELYAEAYTPWEWHKDLQRVAGECGLDLFSTPFDATAVDFLVELDVPALKVASFELVDLPLLRHIAATGRPIIMSTGMATTGEIEEAVRAIREGGGRELALLKCTSAYPAAPEEMNLRTIPHLAETFQVPVGLSDHSLGIAAAVTSVALGACIVEKHLTLSRSTPGPDSAFSLEPHEFRAMAESIRTAERALGRVSYGPTSAENESVVFRRSLFVVEDVRRGERFTEQNVRSIRPGFGLHPRHLAEVIGATAALDVKRGTPLSWPLVARTRDHV